MSILRRELACGLPVQVWHFGRGEWKAELTEMMRPLEVEVVDGSPHAAGLPGGRDRGYALKVLALVHSRFQEVLFLDADNVPVRDPGFLFADAGYQRTGGLFWKDIRQMEAGARIWGLTGVEPRAGAEWESGQMVIDKQRWWRALSAALHLNLQFRFYYRHIHGDKQTFALAAWKTGMPAEVVPRAPDLVEANTCQSMLNQYAPDGSLLFQHRTQADWTLHGVNPEIPGFRWEGPCRRLLEELRVRWNGEIDPDPLPYPLPEEERLGSTMPAPVWFHVHQRGTGRKLMEFRPGGRVGRGRGWDGETWELRKGSGDLILRVDGLKMAWFRKDGAGGWTGRKCYAEEMEIRMIPSAPPGGHAPGDRFREHELLDRCPVCGKGRPVLRRAPELRQCDTCATHFRSPRPVAGEIRRFYESGTTYKFWEAEEAVRRVLWQRRLRRLRRHAAGGRLLDVGTGDGHFLQVAGAAGFIAEGTEISTYAAGRCLQRGFPVQVGTLQEIDFGERRFDVITLWHVLEHVPFPGEVLRRVHGLLVPGGLLAVAAPNEWRMLRGPAGGAAGRGKPEVLHWGAEIHLAHFRPDTLRRLLRVCGFRVVEFGADDVETRPVWWTPLSRTFHEGLGRITGRHGSPAMVFLARRA